MASIIKGISSGRTIFGNKGKIGVCGAGRDIHRKGQGEKAGEN